MIKTKLFKPGHVKSDLNNFLATHEILRMETYPHARQAGLGNYVGVTYREGDEMISNPLRKDCEGCDMENEDKPLGLLHYIKPTFEDSLFSKVLDKVEDSNGESIDKSPTGGD